MLAGRSCFSATNSVVMSTANHHPRPVQLPDPKLRLAILTQHAQHGAYVQLLQAQPGQRLCLLKYLSFKASEALADAHLESNEGMLDNSARACARYALPDMCLFLW